MLLGATVLASTIATARPTLQAVRTDQPIILDGKLDDPAWKSAHVTSAFTQKFPDEGAKPSEPTTVRVLYDDRALWIGIDCTQEKSPIVAPLTRRDRFVEADNVTVSLGTRDDDKDAFDFYVSAAGVLVDAVRWDDTSYSTDWDENWDARVARTAHGWSAEFWIPLRVLRYDQSSTTWQMQVRRYISARQETDEWAFIPRSEAGEVSHYGTLTDLTGLRPKSTSIEVQPFVVGSITRRDPGTVVTGSGYTASGSVGADLKWHVSPDLTLDASVRPDFAQVEADQIILNLTNYETYYPEKRPFFLEGADVFQTPLQLVYTRRIGRAEPNPSLRDGESLVAVPTPATIGFAEKLVGRIADVWTIGLLSALTDKSEVEVEHADGSRENRVIAPLSLWQVMRVKRAVGDNGHIGILATAVTRAEDTTDAPVVDPSSGQRLCPSGTTVTNGRRCFHDSYVASADFRFRSPGGTYATTGQIVSSLVRDGPDRTLPDGTVIAPGDSGLGGSFTVSKEGGEHWLWSLAYDGASRRLDFDDLGFMTRQAYHHAWGELSYRTLTPWWETLETSTWMDVYGRTNLDGLVLERGVFLGEWWRLKDFWQVYAGVHFDGARYDDREIGDGTALERAGLVGQQAAITSDPRKALVAHAYAEVQRIFDGYMATFDATLTWRPTPELDLSIEPNAYFTGGEPRYVGRGPFGEYLFGKLTAKNAGATLRGTWTFTPRLSLQAYAQLFLASGHYDAFQTAAPTTAGTFRLSDLAPGATPATNPDFEDAALNVNVVLRWEYQLGSTLFLVYTRSQAPQIGLVAGDVATLDWSALRRAPAVDVLLAKISYWWG